MGEIRDTARRLGLGRLAMHLIYDPVGRIRGSVRMGGPYQQWLTERGRREMVEAAGRLPPLPDTLPDLGYEVHFLTGAQYWYQTVFCAWSLQAHSPVRITPVVYDDGSLGPEHRQKMARAIAWTRFVSLSQIESRLDMVLPKERFPNLRARRISYPHLRKLTDVHCGRTGWTVVLDSDLLFFRTPEFLLRWLENPSRPCYMRDAGPAYGYSSEIMRRLAGAPIPELVNVGFCGLDSGKIDWDRLELWCGRMTQEEGMHYLLEQALTAMLVAGRSCDAAPERDYIVRPGLDEGQAPTAVLHHYTAQSKRSYFQHSWRYAMRVAGAPAAELRRPSNSELTAREP